MKPETAVNATIGIFGPLVTWPFDKQVAVISGLSAAAWFLWQLGCSVYDRFRKK